MRALIVFAHPDPDSFAAALHATVRTTLAHRGWEIDDCDLYAEGFNPVMTPTERRMYHEYPVNTATVRPYVERLTAADALILVFPVWVFGFPAILKGFLDRVCVPGVAFRLENGKVVPALSNISKLAAVTTYGGSRLRALLAGDPPRRVVSRAIRHYCQGASLDYLALYDMNRATDGQRRHFLARVTRRMERL